MDSMDYDIWAMRIRDAIRLKSGERESGGEKTPPPEPFKDRLIQFAAEASAIVGAIGRNVDSVQITGGQRDRSLDGFLDEMLKFPSFALLEYRYRMPSEKQPGLRFKVEIDHLKKIVVYYFQDLVFWDVDEGGRRLFEVPITFDFSGPEITMAYDPKYATPFAGCATWQEALRETIALPLRPLFM